MKWKDRCHREDTWEEEEQLRAMAPRKLENYILKKARMAEDPLLSCMDSEDPTAQFHEIDRIIGSQKRAGLTYYLVKWEGLPYGESTWESQEDLDQAAIDAFLLRKSNPLTPTISKTRRIFTKLEEQPAYLGGGDPTLRLRPYQLEGVNWMAYSWCNRTNAILADEMGLGKTIQSVCFLSVLAHSYGMTGPSLVVVPLSTIDAWRREFARWDPRLNVLVYSGDARSRTVLRRYELENDFQVVLTTYELVMKDAQILFGAIPFKLLLIDEGHRLKSGTGLLHDRLSSGLAPSSARFLITGTPLQNSLQELWSLLHFLQPERFPSYEDFASQYGTVGTNDAQVAGEQLGQLHALLKPHLLRRMKKDVEKGLPIKTERILRVPLAKEQRELYRLVLTKNYRELAARQSGSNKNVGSLSNILVELKKVCNHPALLEGGTDDLVGSCGKMALLDQLLARLLQDGHRVLIFSQMVRMLDILSRHLSSLSIQFCRIDGSTPTEARRRAIQVFNSPDSPYQCFLLSTRAGGLGINLETADTVIIYDSDWNPQNDLQAMARAHRIGQTRPVSIFRLVSRGTVEETILERAKQKMVLDHLVIGSNTHGGSSAESGQSTMGQASIFSRQELQAILQFGAQNIFAADTDDPNMMQDGKMHFDLDDLLKRTVPLEEDLNDDNGTAGLLGQFQVADFNPIASKEEKRPDEVLGWDQIIPEGVRMNVMRDAEQHELMQKEMEVQEALLVSATSRRRPKSTKDASDGPTADKPSRSTKKSQALPTTHGKSPAMSTNSLEDEGQSRAVSVVLPVSKVEARLVAAAVLKFGLDTERLTSACPNIPHAVETANMLYEATLAHPDTKGLVFPNGFYLSVAQLRDRVQVLQHLANLLKGIRYDSADLASWRIHDPKRRVKNVMLSGARCWSTPSWSIIDDAHLLVGVHRHGFGEWDVILADEELGLAQAKMAYESADPKALPKALHLGRRVEYIVNALSSDPAKAVKKDTIKTERKPAKPSTRPSTKESAKESANEPIDASGETENKKMKHLFKPVRAQLAFLASLDSSALTTRLDELCKAVLSIGRHISTHQDDLEAWAWVTRVWPTEITGKELEALYNKIKAQQQV